MSDKHAEAQAARAAAAQQESSEGGLPQYSSASSSSLVPELSEHAFTLEDSKGRPSIWLTVKSRAKDKKTWPLFYERDIIHGTVEVDFSKIDGAKAVAISVRAHGCAPLDRCSDAVPTPGYRRRDGGGPGGAQFPQRLKGFMGQ